MDRADRTSVAAVVAIVAVGALVAWAGSQGGATVGAWPVFAICGLLSFAMNWVAFVPGYVYQTERYFDLTGSLTYLSVIGGALWLTAEGDLRALVLGAMVAVWAVRLGSFLFARIRREGSDRRFDTLKPSLLRFFMTWSLQGLWVFLTLSCALAAITTARPGPLGPLAWVGGIVWIAGFAIEAIADREKARFRQDPANRGHFIQSGLWAWSRHPNYFGEITLWCGVAIVALPVLTGWQHVTLISPVFVYFLLTRVSGIPLLEARAEEKWGDQAEYRAYRDRTPVLVPCPPQSA